MGVKAGLIGGIASIFGSGVIATAVAEIVVALGIAAILGKVLAPRKPRTGRDTKGIQTIVRNNVLPRRIIYGEAVTGGPYALLNTSGQDNQWLNMIVVLSTHPVEDIIGIFIDDEYVNIAGDDHLSNGLDADYYVDTGSKYGSNKAVQHVQVIKNNGWGYADFQYVTNTNDSKCINDRSRAGLIKTTLGLKSNGIEYQWETAGAISRDSATGVFTDEAHKLTNCSYVFVRVKFNRDVWSGWPKLKFHVKGKRVYNPAYDTSMDSTETSPYNSNITLSSTSPLNTHSLTNPDTWQYTDASGLDIGEDWTLCILDYLLNDFYGLGAKTTGDLPEINWEEFLASFYASSEIVTTGNSFNWPVDTARYTINGVLETSATPIDNLETLLTSGSGELVYAQGKYKLRPGVYRLPATHADIINEDMIVSSLNIRTHTPRGELFNKAGGVYTSKGYNDADPVGNPPSTLNKPKFEPSDFALVDPLDENGVNPYEVADGEEIIQEFDYPFTTREYEAQRLARIQLERIRQGLQLSFEANLEVLKYSVGDTVYLKILSNSKYANESFLNRLGLDINVQPSPPFEAYYKQFKIVEMQYTENSTISVILIEESEEIYDWNDGDANTIDYVLESEIISDDPTGTILVPIFSFIEERVGQTPGTTVTTLIYWNAPQRGTDTSVLDRAHISHYRIEYGEVDDSGQSDPEDRVSTWIHAGSVVANHDSIAQGPLSLETLYKDGVEYDFRIRAVAYSGRASAWGYYSVDTGNDYNPSPAASGATNFYYIRATNGTAIKNGVGTLTVEARSLESGADLLITSPSNKQLYVDGTTLVTQANGYQAGSDGYTGIFDATNIQDSVVVELREGSNGNLLDTISLVDIADGDAAGAGEAAVSGFIEPTQGLAWVQDVDSGDWEPAGSTTNLDVTFVKGGADVARTSRQIIRSATGILTDNGIPAHAGGSFNTSRVTTSISGNSSQALTVKYDYSFDVDNSSVAETVITAKGGLNAPINYAGPYASFESSPPLSSGVTTETIDSSVSWMGNKSLKVVSGVNDGWVYLGTSATDYNLNIPANQQWVLSGYVRLENTNSPKTTNNVDFYLRAGNAQFYGITTESVAADGAWHRISGTLNLSSNNSTTAILRVDNDSYDGAGNTTMYFDGLQLEIDNGSGEPKDHSDTPPPGDDGNDGNDAYQVILTNEAHTLPVDTEEVVDYTGSGTQIRAYKGITELDSIASAGTPTDGEFDVVAAVTTGTVTVGAITTSGLPAVVANHRDMTTDSATITYTVNLEDNTTITKVQSLAKASAGGPGNDGLTALASFAPGHVGGQTNFVVTLNEHQGGTPNDGEIRIQGNTFKHPDGTIVTTDSSDFAIFTNYEGSGVGRFYIMYSATAAETRYGGVAADWGGGSPDDTRFHAATWDSTNGWRATNNAGAYFDITIQSTDCILAVCEKLTASGGIETFVPLYGGLDGQVGWTHDLTFSSIDSNTVAWSTGTVRTASGGIYSISPGGNTSDMTNRTYIYLDTEVSVTALQTTITAANSVGSQRILIAVAEDRTGVDAFFQVFGGEGGLKIAANEIAANAITTNTLAAGAVDTDQLRAGAVEADKISVSKLVSASDVSSIFGETSTGTRVEIEGGSTYPLWYGSGATKNDANATFYVKDDGTMKFQGNEDLTTISSSKGHYRDMYPIYNILPYRSLLFNTGDDYGPVGPQLNGGDIECPAIAEAGSFFTTSNVGIPITGTYGWPSSFGPGSSTIFHPTETSLSGGIYSSQRIANEATPLLIMATARVIGTNSTIELQYRYDGGSWVTIRQLWSLGVNHSFYEWWQPTWNSWSQRIDFRILLNEQASGVLSYYSFQIQVIGFNITAGYRS